MIGVVGYAEPLTFQLPETKSIQQEPLNPPKIHTLSDLRSSAFKTHLLKTSKPDELKLRGLKEQRFQRPKPFSVKYETSLPKWGPLETVDFATYNKRSSLNLRMLDMDHGLPSEFIQSISSDSSGMFWIGTTGAGVFQFDGNRYRRFGSESGLSSDFVNFMLIDHRNHLWIGGEKGLDWFDGDTVRNISTSNGLPHDMIWTLHEDQAHNLWIGTEKGVVKLDSSRTVIEKFDLSNGLPTQLIWAIASDLQGRIWIGTEDGLAILKFQKDGAFTSTIVQEKNGLPEDNIWCIAPDANGNIWLGSNGYGIYKWVLDDDRVFNYNTSHGLSTDLVWFIQPTSSGMWFGSYGDGAMSYQLNDQGKDQFYQISETEGLSNGYIMTITEDYNGAIWMGTDGGGINVLDLTRGVKRHYLESVGLNESVIQSMFRDSDSMLWLGTHSRGVNIIDEKRRQVTYLTEKQGLSLNSVWSIVEGPNKTIFIGTENGLNVYNKTKGTLTVYDTLSGLHGKSPWTLLRDEEDKIWIGTEDKGLGYFDTRLQKFHHFNDHGLDLVPIMALIEDHMGFIWVGTRGNGLYKIDRSDSGEKIEVFTRDSGLSSDSVTYLYQDSRKRIWIGTEKFGLDYFDYSPTPSFNNISSKEGLSSDEVWSITEDQLGRIWMGTVDKITVLKKELDKFEVAGYLSINDGLKSNDLNFSSVLKENNGHMIWATIKGPSVIDPMLFSGKTADVELMVTSIELENQFIDFRTADLIDLQGSRVPLIEERLSFSQYSNVPKKLELPHNIHNISFNFTAKKINYQKNLIFQYKLEGVIDEWVTTENFEVSFNNLGHGEHVLMLRASFPHGDWGPVTTYPFTIRTPWWETWFVKIIGFLAIIGIIYLFYVLRTKNLRQSKLLLENKVQERTQELEASLREVMKTRGQLIHSERMASIGLLSSGVAHELSNPISAVYNSSKLIRRDLDDLFNKKGNEQELKENLDMTLEVLEVASNQTREIIRGLTNYSRLESQEMILGDIHQCIDNSIMLIQSKLTDIKVIKAYAKDVPMIKCYYTELTQVFLNLISNAIDAIQDKGTEGGIIEIKTKIDRHFIKIAICDNGVGMSLETSESIFKNFYTSKEPGRGTGLGLAISQSIIEKHQGSISFETEKGVGTTFITTLPLTETDD